MHPGKVLIDLRFLKEVEAQKRTYYVYEGKQHYVLMTESRAKSSCNLNVVSKEAANYVCQAFGGRKKLTASNGLNESRKPIFIKENFDALNILYVLCAMGVAKTDKRY